MPIHAYVCIYVPKCVCVCITQRHQRYLSSNCVSTLNLHHNVINFQIYIATLNIKL